MAALKSQNFPPINFGTFGHTYLHSYTCNGSVSLPTCTMYNVHVHLYVLLTVLSNHRAQPMPHTVPICTSMYMYYPQSPIYIFLKAMHIFTPMKITRIMVNRVQLVHTVQLERLLVGLKVSASDGVQYATGGCHDLVNGGLDGGCRVCT